MALLNGSSVLQISPSSEISSDGRTDPDSYLPLLLAKLHFLDRENVRRAAPGETRSTAPKPDEAAESAATSPTSPAPAPVETPDQGFSGDEKSTSPTEDAEKEEKKVAGGGGAAGLATGSAPPSTPASGITGVSTGGDGEGHGGDGAKSERDGALAGLRAVVAAADDVVAKIDRAEVARQLGMNVDSEDPSMVAARKEFEDKKKALVDAFARKARALAEVEQLLGESEVSKANSPFLATYSDLLCWADVAEDKYTRVTLAFLHRKGRLGMMVKMLTKLLSSTSKVLSKEEAYKARAQVFGELGWKHLLELDQKWAIIGHPRDFPLF